MVDAKSTSRSNIKSYSQKSHKLNRRNLRSLESVWPDWEIFYTLGNFVMPLATINLPKYPTFLGNFCKVVKIYHICSEIIFGQLFWTFGDFFLVTLIGMYGAVRKISENVSLIRKLIWLLLLSMSTWLHGAKQKYFFCKKGNFVTLLKNGTK